MRGGGGAASRKERFRDGESANRIESGMVGSGMGMNGIVRLGVAIGAVLAMLAAGATATAFAEPPALTISSPPTGTLTSERSPAFSGTTSDTLDSVTLDIYQGADAKGTRVREELVAPIGNSWGVAPAALSDGTYTAVAQQTDSATLEPGTSQEVTFTVDGTAPSVTLNAVPAATNKAVSFSGSAGTAKGAAADAEIVKYVVWAGAAVGGAEAASGSVSVNGGGSWSSGQVSLADGTYTVQAFQRDQAGNEGASAAATFRLDTVAPTGLSVNAIGPVISNPAPTLGGSAGTQEGDGPVRVFLDGKLVSEAQVAGGQWSYSSAPLSDGVHTVRAEQVDEAGNVSKTSSTSFRVDTTSPGPTVNTPKGGETLKSSTVTFSGAAGNAEGDSTSLAVEVVKDDGSETVQKLTVTRNGGEWSSKSIALRLSNGTYTVHAEQLDSAGNKGLSAPVTFTVASPAPTVTLQPLPHFTNDPTPGFSGIGDTSDEASDEVIVKVFAGNAAPASGKPVESIATTLSPAGGGWAAQLGEALPEGTYTAQVEQPPAVGGNPTGVSDTTTFTVDTTAPAPTLSGPEHSTGLETVSGTAGVARGDRRQVTAELFQGSTVEEGAAFETITVNADQSTGSWSATFANLGGGQYTVLARQSDEAGNTGTSPAQSFTVDVPPSDPPVVPAPTPPTAAFTWVPSNPTVGQAVSFVSKSTDGSTPITGLAWDFAGPGPFAAGPPVATTTFTTTGAHTVRLQVTDADGLSSTATQTVNVAAQVLRLMQPFPIVRIAGSETAFGAKVKLLTVQAPAAAKVAVTCKGRGCRTKAESRIATASSKSKRAAGGILLAFPRFERSLKAGAVLQIRVSRSGEIGKFTSFTIRRKKLPVRVDACLRPPSSSPSPCPSQ
jgi:large repetitive protein